MEPTLAFISQSGLLLGRTFSSAEQFQLGGTADSPGNSLNRTMGRLRVRRVLPLRRRPAAQGASNGKIFYIPSNQQPHTSVSLRRGSTRRTCHLSGWRCGTRRRRGFAKAEVGCTGGNGAGVTDTQLLDVPDEEEQGDVNVGHLKALNTARLLRGTPAEGLFARRTAEKAFYGSAGSCV